MTRLLLGAVLTIGLAACNAAVAAPVVHNYTLPATEACLAQRADTVVGLPPATPVPGLLFVDRLKQDALSSWGIDETPRKPHKQLGAWFGGRSYEGVILSFFGSASDARVSRKSIVSLYGGERIQNVVLSWDQEGAPTSSALHTIVGCLRSAIHATATPTRPSPQAALATFAGEWGGHTRWLTINATGVVDEGVDSGCCTHEYVMTARIVSVSGTLTHATADFQVTSFTRYDKGIPRVRRGQRGRLFLRNGIVTNGLTRVYYCSNPAWGATGACGA